MTENKARFAYYFAVWNLSLSRVIHYWGYTWYCERLSSRIIDYSLNNYEEAGIL